MQHVILVVSPDPEFVHQVQSHLEEGGRYQVTGAITAQEALTLANQNFYEIAILDGDLQDIPVAAFSRDLSALQTDLKILVFPPGNDPRDPVLEGLVTNGFLTKPFSGQEVGSALTRLLSDQPHPQQSPVDALDDLVKQWLEIPENGEKQARQILTATTAQSALISIKGEFAAHSGDIDNNLLAEVSDFLLRYWHEEENNEIARYLGIEEKSKFVYATKLVSNVVLVLVYPHTIPIQQVRRELNQVKNELQKNYPSTNEIKQEIAQKTLAQVHEQSKTLESMQPFSPSISQDELDALSVLGSKPSTDSESPGISMEELEALNTLIAAMPAPDPQPEETGEQDGAQEKKPQWLNELEKAGVAIPTVETAAASEAPAKMEEEQAISPFLETEPENIPATKPDTVLLTENGGDQSPSDDGEPLPEIDFVLPWETEQETALGTEKEIETLTPPGMDEQGASFAQLLSEAAVDPATDPEPNSFSEPETSGTNTPEPETYAELRPAETEVLESNTVSEPQSIDVENLTTESKVRFNYTCLLIPQDKNIFLTRDLSERLGGSLPQFHQAQGWQLINMTIRPQYMLWTVSIPFEVCPHQVIHQIRSLTSAQIFANFPEIARKKTSEDFWSSEYLAVSGMELPPASLISDFVARAWQVQAQAATS